MSPSENKNHLVILLNDLARINNDRIEGYKRAEKLAWENEEIRSIFRERSSESEEFVAKLQELIELLGGDYATDTSFQGKIFRAWMTIKHTFKQHSTLSILDSCEFSEGATIKAYDEALNSDLEIPAKIRQDILEQQTAIRKSLDIIKKYGDLNLSFFKYNNSFTL